MNMVQYKEAVTELTMDDANEWNDTNEKFIFCVDFLEISAHDANSDRLVRALERRMEAMLVAENIHVN